MFSIYQTLFTLSLLLLIIGCDRDPVVSDIQPEPVLTEGSPGYLRLPINGAIKTLDPGLTEDNTSIELTEQLFLALTDFDPLTYQVVPELATHWQVYDQGRRYRFYLRQDTFWSDGQAVTATDIVWAIQRNIVPKTNAPYASALYVLTHAKALHQGRIDDVSRLGVQAIDPFTVEFQLRHSISNFPALVSLWVYRPLPRRAIETWHQHWTLPGKLVSNGPYQLQDWQPGRQLVLRKNPYYFAADQVMIDEVHYLTVVENSLGLTLYQHNALDVMGGAYLPLPRGQLTILKRDPDLREQYRRQSTLCSYTYGFNVNRSPTDDVRVRKAIAAAINRGLLVEAFMQGAAQASSAYVVPVDSAVSHEGSPGIDFDPVQARAWLAAAGYPEGKDFPPLTLMYNTSEIHHTVALAVQAFLGHSLNITLTLKQLPWPQYIQAIEQPQTPHLFRFGWCADYPDPYSWLSAVAEPATAVQRLGWTALDFAQQLERTLRQTNPVARQQGYRQLEYQLLTEQAVIVPLYFQTHQYLVKPWLKNWSAMPFGGQPVRNWGLVNSK
ncbi:hypothetical protein AB835_03775 [Candidatus Endobugula sertula]|uniref:Solute-binding protein family 5 domain-containing protein n=1 Tax=Candidatus Endobugula sertula TaxID=62101 RepID=A0A1D2QS68_9GAMM|nr:hypothetical protein AB835_03775 [Candidatus Endobugula sertula]